jgi:hypothetical protein
LVYIKNTLLVYAITVVLCMTILSSIVYATKTEDIFLNPSEIKTLTYNLNEGDKFSGSLSTSESASLGPSGIIFGVADQSGNIIINSSRISGNNRAFNFTAQATGAYTLYFDNSLSLYNIKYVTLAYNIERATVLSLTIDSATWVIIFVVVLSLLALIGFGIYVVAIRNRNRLPISPPS